MLAFNDVITATWFCLEVCTRCSAPVTGLEYLVGDCGLLMATFNCLHACSAHTECHQCFISDSWLLTSTILVDASNPLET